MDVRASGRRNRKYAGGTVTGSAGGSPTSDALERQAVNIRPNPHYGAALGYADRIADALKEATDADAKWAPKLRALKADDDLVVSDRDWVDVKSDRGGVLKAADPYLDSIKAPPKEATPEENAEWWKNLTSEQRADYLAVHPNSIGSMNGLPSDVRDEANRMVLNETKARYQLELDAIPKEPTKYRSRRTVAQSEQSRKRPGPPGGHRRISLLPVEIAHREARRPALRAALGAARRVGSGVGDVRQQRSHSSFDKPPCPRRPERSACSAVTRLAGQTLGLSMRPRSRSNSIASTASWIRRCVPVRVSPQTTGPTGRAMPCSHTCTTPGTPDPEPCR